MAQVELTIKRLECLRCGHSWIPNSESTPKVCPLCHSPYWNKQRTARRAVVITARIRKRGKRAGRIIIPKSMFGVSPDLPKFEREEDDFRL